MFLTGMLHAVEAHSEGEVARVIVGGVVDVPGDTLAEKCRYLERERDAIRRLLVLEPRGQPGMFANLVLPPTRPEADASFVIMGPQGYPPMSGSNTMCVATVLLETGMLPMTEPVTELTLEAPAGLIRVRAECAGGRVKRVTLRNVPAFAARLDAPLELPGWGTVSVDVAFGGGFFAIVEAARFGLSVTPDEAADLVVLGLRIRDAANAQLTVSHPELPGLGAVGLTLFRAPPTDPRADAKNATVIPPGILDRSPCGTGTSALLAVLHARGQLGLEQDFVHESILGTLYTGRVIGTTRVGDYVAVIPTIAGRAWITGLHQYATDPDDPLKDGFALGDLWNWVGSRAVRGELRGDG